MAPAKSAHRSSAQRATVLETLPNARYRVALDDGREVAAHLSGDSRIQVVRILAGDVVTVEVSPFDSTKARITRREPPNQNPEHEARSE